MSDPERSMERAALKGAATFNIDALLRPDAYPHPVSGPELIETHVSWVILTGEVAYKIKKPVHFDFLDASTADRRLRLCEEELVQNRRLAPDLYLDVVPIGGTPDAPRVGASGPALDHAVRMRQFDRSQELSALLVRGEVGRQEVAKFAERLAAFHASGPPAGAQTRYGSLAQVSSEMLDNLAALVRQSEESCLIPVPLRLDEWLRKALTVNRDLVQERKAGGAVRECHGDLHARNIVRWKAELVAFDCLEFDPALRWIDVASDVAFLHMDLLGYARPDLASVFLSAYLESGGDYQSLRVARLYEVHRALVRAKVDGFAALGASSPQRAEVSCARRERRIGLAAAIAGGARPRLILMSGLSGSGKSWLSERLVPSLGLLRARSDLERKRVSGMPAREHAPAAVGHGLYGRAISGRTYAQLIECAEHALAGGYGIIIDAAFLEVGQRDSFRELAHRLAAPFLLVRCEADAEVLRRRVRERAASDDPSDASLAVLEHQLATARPLESRELPSAVIIDTSVNDAGLAAVHVVGARLARVGRPQP